MKAILFDFWGTLVENGLWSPTKQVKNILKIDLPFPEYVIRMERAMMTKSFLDLNEAFRAVCQEFGVDADEEIIEELVGLWNKNWMLAKPYDETKKVLEQLKLEYKLVLIANTDNFSIKNVLEKFKLNGLFDKVIFSCELGLIKTDKKFLLSAISDLGVEIEDCLVVGDSIQSDIIPAKRNGMNAVLIDRKEQRHFDLKIKNLEELSIILA